MPKPKISYVIPVLNSANVLPNCLLSIKKQRVKDKDYEILIIDGGSTDDTIKIAKKYNSIILRNPLKTAEAGKAIGIRHAKGEFICLIDSDNILPEPEWLSKMLYPFSQNSKIIGTEPIRFTYRPGSGLIERYSALIGANDPYAFITGFYDKQNYINNKWTGLKIEQIDKNQYIQIKLVPHKSIPTIGANGTIFKTNFLKQNLKSDYLFDIDIISQVLQQTQKPLYFAKVKTSIIHTFCESSITKFIRKQNRRLTDYYIYKPLRQFNWDDDGLLKTNKFIFYTITLIPAIFDSVKGYFHQPDLAWFFHPLACFITLTTYIKVFIQYKLGTLKSINREKWHQ